MQNGAGNFERRELVLARADAGAHLGERQHDALHRPARQRFIANQAARKWLRRENTGNHADGRAGIAGIEIAGRLPQAVQPAAMYDELGANTFHVDAQRPDAAQRRVAVGAGRIVADARCPFGDGADESIPVRNRLIARQRDGAGNRRSGSDDLSHADLLF